MAKSVTPSTIAQKQNVDLNQKAWKYIRDVNSQSLSDLNKIAMRDGKKAYSYGRMFHEWERYAAVFTKLGMTGKKHARVGILGSTAAEVIFSVYGLNMTGADVSLIASYSSLMPWKLLQTIRSEKLTDFIVTDDFAQPNLINELLVKRNELGLRNVIVLHIPVAGVTVNGALAAGQEMKYRFIEAWYGPVCMNNLLSAYGEEAVYYAEEANDETAFILHTTGTTTGTGKPVPLSDYAFNTAGSAFYDYDGFELPWDNLVTAAIVDLSNAYSMVDQVHVPFAMGACVVMTPAGVLNPAFYKAIPEYGISFLFTVSAMFERWMKMKEQDELDFSGLSTVILGGAAVSAADKRRYSEFMEAHGGKEITLLNGYGISELGGACCISTADLNDESIGYPLPGVKIRLYDEDHEKFLPEGKRPAEGVLYMNSPSLATTVLDGEEILKSEEIDGLKYICTNDLVRMDADGRITFLGRANRYFINDEGKKYESGRVEIEIARQEDIESCGVVPVYVKTTHDNIPMLCVKTLENDHDPQEIICKALRQVFVSEKTLHPDNIPSRVMIVEELPRNGNGKIDLHAINSGAVEGDVYTVKTVKVLDKITDFKLEPYEEGPADMIKEVFDGLSAELKDSLPFNKKNGEEKEMKNAKKAMENFNAMNQMGRQLMSAFMGKMGQQWNGKMPDFQNMMNGMPDFQNMMNNIPETQQKVVNNAKGMAQNTAQNVLPTMRAQMEQMIQCMDQMNKMSLSMMQKMFDQNCKMMEQCFNSLEAMSGVNAAAKEEAPAEEPAEESEEEAPKAKKKTKTKNVKADK